MGSLCCKLSVDFEMRSWGNRYAISWREKSARQQSVFNGVIIASKSNSFLIAKSFLLRLKFRSPCWAPGEPVLAKGPSFIFY